MNKIFLIIMVAVLLVGGGYFLTQKNQVKQPESIMQTETTTDNNLNNQNQINIEITTEPKITTHEVVYTDAGYSPVPLTIKVGDMVTFKNQSSAGIWTGSAMHPSHTVYGGTSLQQHCPDAENNDFDQCKSEGPGTSWSFTFTKVGTWGYHNHVNSTHFGKIIVE